MSFKKTLIVVLAVAALTAAAMLPAAAQSANAEIVAVLGDANVGPGTPAGGLGLCFPAVDCGGAVAGDVVGFSFNAPSPVILPNGTAVPGQCVAAGTLGVDASCTLVSSGTVSGVVAGVTAPSCGNSTGSGSVDIDINGTVTTVPIGWISSAGGTLPITAGGTAAEVAANAANGVVVLGLIQARPLGFSAGTPAPGDEVVPCLTVPATTFTVVGVTAAAIVTL